jgi:hypothetical protein
MDNLNKYHKSKSQVHKFKCEKTNKELTHESFNYDNTPSEFVPLLINAINELKERICSLERMLENDRNTQPKTIEIPPTSSKQKKPLAL